MKKLKLITAPIFYVNAKPHIGHLYSTVMADTLARYHRLNGFPALLSVGTDEHGLKVQQAALSAKMTPILFCDSISVKFRELFERADIHGSFIRTTEKRHDLAVKALWRKIEDNGFIYKGWHEGWYSISDESFVVEAQVEEKVVGGILGNYSKETGKKVEWLKEENYKFRLSLFKGALLNWIDKATVIYPESQRKVVMDQLRQQDLPDLSISRLKSRVSWGITVPGDDNHVVYVWLDALTNYLTNVGFPEKDFAWPPECHVIGKDILKFHAIYWPAFLMAAELSLPKKIISHGHWLINNRKMSKSDGNGVDTEFMMQKYGIETLRYFLMRDGGISIDPEFKEEMVSLRYKKDLAGQLGNLAMRSTSLKINPSGLIPNSLIINSSKDEQEILNLCNSLRNDVNELIEVGKIAEALAHISTLVAKINKYWSIVEPWRFEDTDANRKRLLNILYITCEGMRIVAILMQPVMPSTMLMLLDALRVPRDERSFDKAVIGGCSVRDRIVSRIPPLFPKL